MSIAGKRAGLDGERSGLFYEAIRIIKETRCATDGRYPRYALFENVKGVFSSNGGEDFRAVLEAFCSVKGEDIPVPRPERWANAGEIVADGFSLAWRVLDAQYWGVPQRRNRIYLVADFAGGSAGKILFESEGLSGYSAEGFRTWQRAAGNAADGTGNAGGDGVIAFHVNQRDETIDLHGVSGALMATRNMQMQTFVVGDAPRAVENHPTDGRVRLSEDGTVQTLTSRMGTGGNNVPLVMGTPKTLKIRSGCEGGGKGPLIQDDRSATLSCGNDLILFVPKAYGIGDYKDPPLVNDAAGYAVRRLTPTECARLQGFPSSWCADLGTENPTDEEIAFWTDVWETHRRLVSHGKKPKTEKQIRKWLADPHTDSAEYKMWGNGIALPCAVFVLAGIAWAHGQGF